MLRLGNTPALLKNGFRTDQAILRPFHESALRPPLDYMPLPLFAPVCVQPPGRAIRLAIDVGEFPLEFSFRPKFPQQAGKGLTGFAAEHLAIAPHF